MNPRFGLSETLRKLGVYDRLVANKTCSLGERGRRATELALPCQVA